MEYLLAHFSRSRRVMVDDIFSGRTEEIIELEAGAHIVALGPPCNFTPPSIKIVLRDTSPLTPMEVAFEPA